MVRVDPSVFKQFKWLPPKVLRDKDLSPQELFDTIDKALSKGQKAQIQNELGKLLLEVYKSDKNAAISLIKEIKKISEKRWSNIGNKIEDEFNAEIWLYKRHQIPGSIDKIEKKYGVSLKLSHPRDVGAKSWSSDEVAITVMDKLGKQIGYFLMREHALFFAPGRLEEDLQRFLQKEKYSLY